MTISPSLLEITAVHTLPRVLAFGSFSTSADINMFLKLLKEAAGGLAPAGVDI